MPIYKKNKTKIKIWASRVDLKFIKGYLRPIRLGLKGELQEEIAFWMLERANFKAFAGRRL